MYTLDMVSRYLSICSFIPFLANFSLRSSGERTPVGIRMQNYIPENWFLCKTGRQFSANVWDQETGTLKQQSPTTFTVRRVMERRDGTSFPGEWYGSILFLWSVADFLFS
jgi:hypothetical protein